MITRITRSLAILLVFLLVAMTAPGAPPSPVASPPAEEAQQTMPDGLMTAFLEASSQAFALGTDGYRAHSGGLDVALDPTGLQANVSGIAWGLALRALGRKGQITPPPQAEIAQTDDRLEYRRGVLTEWYRDTALGVEQGFTVDAPPHGVGPLILLLDLSTDLTGVVDTDGRGLSLGIPDGQTLRYGDLRAWDANGMLLSAQMSYTPGQVTLEVNDRGAIYPVTVDPLLYVEQKVVAADGQAVDYFGDPVALWEDTALVGVPFDDVGTNQSQGSAYVFTRSGTTWSLEAHLTASDGKEYDYFGQSVALWKDTALLGAPSDDVVTDDNQGSAYVFTRSGTRWTEQAQLVGSGSAIEGGFGASVALWGDTALVGAPRADAVQGSAYIFTSDRTAWREEAHLTAPGGEAGDAFGHSVALWEDTALVGAPWDDVGANSNQGSVYVFARSGMTWSE